MRDQQAAMREVLDDKFDQRNASQVLTELELEGGKYFIVSVHREENIDSRENLTKIVSCLEFLYGEYNYPIIESTHPRTKKRLEKLSLSSIGMSGISNR